MALMGIVLSLRDKAFKAGDLTVRYGIQLRSAQHEVRSAIASLQLVN